MATRVKKSTAQPVAEELAPKAPAGGEKARVKAVAKAAVKPAAKPAAKTEAEAVGKKTVKAAGKKAKGADRAASSESTASINPTSAWPFPIGPRPK